MNNRRKLLLVLLAVIAIIGITVGVTLAFFSYAKEGVKENTITSGAITFHYNEDSLQGIQLLDALPMSDADGKTQNKYFDFTITSNNNMETTIPYQITSRKVSNSANELDEQYIKVYLTRVTSGNSESQLLFDTYDHLSTEQHNNHDEEVLWSDSVPTNTASYEQRYRLRIWIADTLDFSPEKNQDGSYKEENGEYVYPNNNKEFSIKINVYSEAEAGIKLSPGLYNANNELVYTWQQLIDNNIINVTDGALSAGTNSNRTSLLDGNLVIVDDITSIENDTFYGCNKLTGIELPSGLTSIGNYAFKSCGSLTNIEIPSSVTSIGIQAFYGLLKLTSIEIPANVISIGNGAFSGCTKLASVTFASGSQLTSIGQSAFYGCTGLTSIEIPSNVTSIAESTFSGCTNLTGVTFASGSQLTSIEYRAFNGCTGLTSIEIPASVTSIGESAFKDTGLTSIEIPSSVTSIGSYAFSGCTGLTSIEIPSSVISIGSSAFSECTGLTSIIVDSNNTVYDSRNNSNAIIKTSTNELIAGCKNTVIPSGVTKIGNYAFSGCTGLTSIEIPASVTSIGNRTFQNCTSLTSIEIPSNVTSIGQYAFAGCTGVSSLIIPSGVSYIGIGAFIDINTIYYSGSATNHSPWGAGQVISNY